MTFLYPLGLLGLIGIPILIIIYIIKTKYTEQTVASTYLWILSEKFLKRRNPFSRITGIISLILQILAIALVSMAIARPMITMPGAANEYCFVLDGSASMQMELGEQTRFNAAKQVIATKIEEATGGSKFSLIYAGSEAVVVFEEIDSKEDALMLLAELESGHDDDSIQEAVQIAQTYFNLRPSILTYLLTDTDHIVNENIELVNVAGEQTNFAITNVSQSITEGTLTVVGDLVCYGEGDALQIDLYIDGAQESAATNVVVVMDGQTARFQLSCKAESFSSLKIVADTGDDFAMDDAVYVFDIKSDNAYNVLLVSDAGFFLKSVLGALGHNNVTLKTSQEFKAEFGGEVSGFGLYIFDGCMPEKMPSDGAVWVLNPTGSSDDAGFSYQTPEYLEGKGRLDKTTSSNSLARMLTKDLSNDPIYIKEYVKCSLYRNFSTIYSYDGTPIIFAGTNSHGNRQVVFAFDLHNSTLPLQGDLVVLLRNCLEYSFPAVVEKSDYYVGETAQINILANCDSIRVESPLSNVTYLDVNTAVSDVYLNESGVYTITAVIDGTQRQFKLFAAVPESQRAPVADVEEVSIVGEAVPGGFDGRYDPLLILFICLAVIFAVEWGVYCYEKRQLR